MQVDARDRSRAPRMTMDAAAADGTTALREAARDWGRSQLEAPPWGELQGRLTLLLVDPPAVHWAAAELHATLWIVAEASEVRTLPDALRDPLTRDGSTHERAHEAAALTVDLTVFTLERLEGVLSGAGRRSLETRWSVRHAEPVHDPLRRHERLSTAAQLLPDDAPRRIARTLYVDAHASITELSRLIPQRAEAAIIAAGEAAGAVARLACSLDEGFYPPAEWLLPAARETQLGRRVASWLDDLPRALGGDDAATRRVADGCDPVLRAVRDAVRVRMGADDWLWSPRASALRAPR